MGATCTLHSHHNGKQQQQQQQQQQHLLMYQKDKKLKEHVSHKSTETINREFK